MSPFLLRTTPTSHSSTFFTFSCSFKPNRNPIIITKTFPPRDTIIDFGKFKGKMLGTLPSTYLKWVSKNLRARDFEHWAKLADQVLEDPVYKDRIEWEFAENVLTGNNISNNNVNLSGNDGNISAVSQLFELSERFGWDNENKAAWSRVNFELLGTSKGGRIPRILDNKSEKEKEKELFKMEKKERAGIVTESEERRRERRMRLKEKLEIRNINSSKVRFDDRNGEIRRENIKSDDDHQDSTVETNSPFPGREALLKKVLNPRYIHELEDNLHALQTELQNLHEARNDLMRKVNVAEKN